ncbi:alanine racemase [Spizellomyces sp. 'palustris']|nr:alanine racemase [Spizellomyces sp. 'palustris']
MPFTSPPPPGIYPARATYSKDELRAAYVGRSIEELRTPAFLVDRTKVEQNAKELIDAAKQAGVDVRVHVKTHKTIEGALLQLGDSLSSIIVSTLAEARYFANSGLFQDILYAVPLSPDKIQEVHQVSQRIEKFHVMVDNDVIIDALERYAIAVGPTATSAVNPSSAVSQGRAALDPAKPMFRAFLKIDTGYGRAGVPSTTSNAISLASRLHNSAHICFSGLYSHSGHSYEAADIAGALATAKEEARLTLALAQELRSMGITAPVASVGATPSVKALLEMAGAGREAIAEARLGTVGDALMKETGELANDVAASALPDDEQDEKKNKGGSDESAVGDATLIENPTHKDFKLEVHLGNYIFLDIQQISGMPWPISRCAATVLSRVLSQYSHRNEVLIDTGALALSKDGPGARGAKLYPGYGVLAGDYLAHRTVSRVSQEHGVVAGLSPEEIEAFLEIGTTVEIVPNHACLAAANFEWYYIVEEGKVVDVWVPCRSW